VCLTWSLVSAHKEILSFLTRPGRFKDFKNNQDRAIKSIGAFLAYFGLARVFALPRSFHILSLTNPGPFFPTYRNLEVPSGELKLCFTLARAKTIHNLWYACFPKSLSFPSCVSNLRSNIADRVDGDIQIPHQQTTSLINLHSDTAVEGHRQPRLHQRGRGGMLTLIRPPRGSSHLFTTSSSHPRSLRNCTVLYLLHQHLPSFSSDYLNSLSRTSHLSLHRLFTLIPQLIHNHTRRSTKSHV
jgi:hypothetical protein